MNKKKPLIGDFGYKKYLWEQVSRKIDLIALETWKEFGEFNLDTIEHKIGFDGAIKFDNQRKNLLKKIPSVAAVYFVFSQTDVVYIGQTANLHNRFSAHDYMILFREHNAKLITWVNIDTHYLTHIENVFIYRLTPLLNGISFQSLRDTLKK